MHQEECIVVKFSEGLGIFDQHYGSPQIDEQEIYDGPTGKVIDIQGIQAHAGHDFFVPEGKEFSLNIDQCPSLHIAIKAEPGTNTCLFLLVHERKHDWNQRFVVIGKTPKGECRHHLMSNYFRIKDDNKWREYVYELRTIREEKDNNVYHQPICPDAGSIREIQFYSWTGPSTHTFHFNCLLFKPETVVTELSKQLQKFSRELAQSTGVAEKDVQKILDELGVSEIIQLSASPPPYEIFAERQVQKFSRGLAQPTGVAEKDVQKILDELGGSEIIRLTASPPPKQISFGDIRMAVKYALKYVLM